MLGTSPLIFLLRRDRAVVITSLVGIITLAWLYILHGAGMDMRAIADMAMPTATMVWRPDYFALMLIMWAVMMAAMMLPSAAPTILLYTVIARKRREQGEIVAWTGIFALGYGAVWLAFSLAATTLQWRLDAAALLSPMMMITNAAVAGSVLIAAGFYQWSPFKLTCLRKCQSPLNFFLENWREGAWGALSMGLRHGLFCVGCCWVLMLLLFVGGVMNIVWIIGLSLFVLAEKTMPPSDWLRRAAGTIFIIWGGVTLMEVAI